LAAKRMALGIVSQFYGVMVVGRVTAVVSFVITLN